MSSRHWVTRTTYGVCESKERVAGLTDPMPTPWPMVDSSTAPFWTKWCTLVDSKSPPVETMMSQSPVRSSEPTHSGAIGPPTQVPASQVSAVVHALVSSQAVADSGACVQEPAASQRSSVQSLKSVAHGAPTMSGWCWHCPAPSQSSAASTLPLPHLVPLSPLLSEPQLDSALNTSPSPLPVTETESGVSHRPINSPLTENGPLTGSTVPERS